jgi:hypothetical protein
MGGHPRLARFIEFAEGEGCTISISSQETAAGQEVAVITITNPRGGHVIVVAPDLEERLPPSTVAYFQRRLGIKTPFNSGPAEGE